MKLKCNLSLFFMLLFACFRMVSAMEPFEEQQAPGYNSSITPKTDSLLILKKQIGVFAKKKEYKNAITYSKKLLEKAKVLADSNYINNAYWRQGFYFKKIDQLDSAYLYFDKAYTIHVRLKDSIGAGDRMLDMANIQNSLGDYNGSMITAIEGLKYIENSKEIESITGLYQTISVAQKELENYNEALRWSDKIFSLLTSQSLSDTHTENNYIFKITRANIFAALKKFDISFKILDTIAKKTKRNNQFQYSRAICNMGYYKWLENKNNPESESLLLNSFQIRQELNTVSGLISSSIHLAEYYYETNKPKALSFANEAFIQSKILGNPVAILESLDLLLPLKKALRQDVSEEAITYSETQKKLEKTKQAIRSIYAATKYDNDTLEKNNLTLLAKVATKEKQNSIAISIAVFLFILIGFVIYYKNQQKKKEQLEMAYKTELRLSKKLHDELGNDVFYLMTQLQKKSTEVIVSKNVLILDGLNSIYQRIRDISKEYTAIQTGENFGKEFLALLNSYGSTQTKLITKELEPNFWDHVSPKVKIEVYRILQELLVNMKKHSNASLVAITCTKNHKLFTIKYVDNGIGFNLKDDYSGNGLRNVENRINAIKGTINFESKPNEGVSATITFAI